MKTDITVNKLLLDNSVSFWLKNALRDLERRDVVDAAHDAELLALVFKERCEMLFKLQGVVLP